MLIAEIGDTDEIQLVLDGVITNLTQLRDAIGYEDRTLIVFNKDDLESHLGEAYREGVKTGKEEIAHPAEESEDESEEEEDEEEDDEDEPQFTFACCGQEGAFDPEDICSDCIMRPYKNKAKIEKVFAPQDEKELEVLMRIAEEARWIDIKPYSHNIVGLSLSILGKTHNYDKEKIKLVVKTFGLDRKGWGHLLGDAEESEDEGM